MSDDLVTWLRAQLDEDERVVRNAEAAVAEHGGSEVWPDHRAYTDEEGDALDQFAKSMPPARVRHEIEAKRRLLDYLDRLTGYAADGDRWAMPDPDEARELLALPYSDRPGYREEWRP